MSKIATAALIVLCLATATGCWLIYGIEYRRQGREMREVQARENSAVESEMYQAWHHATRYETFRDPLANSKLAPESQTLTARLVWSKAFQKSDVKLAGKSQKYGNASYQITSVVKVQNRVSANMLDAMLRTHAPDRIVQSSLDGDWYYLSMECKVERMDGPGDWIASDWKFSPITYGGDFPFELVLKRVE